MTCEKKISLFMMSKRRIFENFDIKSKEETKVIKDDVIETQS